MLIWFLLFSMLVKSGLFLICSCSVMMSSGLRIVGFSCLSTQVSFLKQHLDGVSLFVDSCKGSFVTNDGEVPDIPFDYSK